MNVTVYVLIAPVLALVVSFQTPSGICAPFCIVRLAINTSDMEYNVSGF